MLFRVCVVLLCGKCVVGSFVVWKRCLQWVVCCVEKVFTVGNLVWKRCCLQWVVLLCEKGVVVYSG